MKPGLYNRYHRKHLPTRIDGGLRHVVRKPEVKRSLAICASYGIRSIVTAKP